MQNYKPVANGRAVLPSAQELGTKDEHDAHTALHGLQGQLDAVIERIARLERMLERQRRPRRIIRDAAFVAAALAIPVLGLVLLWRFF